MVGEIKTIRFSPTVQDEPSSALLQLSFTNDTGNRLCIEAQSWPSRGGFINTNGDDVYLLVRGLKYFHRKELDNCPGGCGEEFPAGKRLDGFLRYEVFGLPPELHNEPKVLRFEATAWRCPRGSYE